MQLVSVENADLPADLFKAPARGPPGLPYPEPDRSSHHAEAYIARGLPAPDRVWTGEEYTRAAAAIEKAAAGGPRPAAAARRAPKSGGVFSRIVNPANLEIARRGRRPGACASRSRGGITVGADQSSRPST